MQLSVTLVIVLATGIISFQAFSKRDLFYKLLFSPYQVKHSKQWYRFLTCGLVHAHWPHLLVNMFVLYSFAAIQLDPYGGKHGLEADFMARFGAVKGLVFFVTLYIGGLLFSSLPALKKHGDNVTYNAVGASGAVSAVLYSAIVLNPFSELGLLILPGIRFPAILFGVLYLAYEWYMDKRSKDNVAHDAHFWGAIFGVTFTLLIDPQVAVEFINQVLNYFS